MMKAMEFGEWLPDQPPVGNPGVIIAKNVIPFAKGYKQLSDISAYSGAITARCQGAISAQDADGVVADFCGDLSKLYKLTDVTWGDVSGATYTTSTDERWKFLQFGQNVLATNWTDNIQTYDMSVGGTFGDLNASAPRCKYLASARNFVFAGYTYDASDGNMPSRIRWSALNDATSWAASVTTQADWQDLPDENGPVTGVTGGEFITVFQERAVTRGDYVGVPAIWSFSEISTNLGCSVPGSIIKQGATTYFLSSEDFYSTTASGIKPLGAQRVAKWFYQNYNQTYPHRVTAAVDPINSLVIWSFPSNESASGTPDTLIIYNWVLDRWTYASVSHDLIYRSLSKGYTLEGLDAISSNLDTLPLSLDSRAYSGGQVLLSAFTTDFKLAFFTGSALAAQIDTGDFSPQAGRQALVQRVRPVVEGSTAVVTVQHAGRDIATETVTFGSAISPTATGNTPIRQKARYHRIRVNVTGGFDFIQGIEVEAKVLGTR
jgi:hypothetical protein